MGAILSMANVCRSNTGEVVQMNGKTGGVKTEVVCVGVRRDYINGDNF